jgi:hypothetical protein
MQTNTITISPGNGKLGKMPNFSIPAGDTCPGKSEFCKGCYAQKGTFKFNTVKSAYTQNLESTHQDSFVETMIGHIQQATRKTKTFRIHVAGDFYSATYTRKWIAIVQALPDVQFYTYTRSWRVASIRPTLEELHALPNIQIFASMDATIEEPAPEGWRVATIKPEGRDRGMKCLEQVGTAADCQACGYCFRKTRGNVVFQIH